MGQKIQHHEPYGRNFQIISINYKSYLPSKSAKKFFYIYTNILVNKKVNLLGSLFTWNEKKISDSLTNFENSGHSGEVGRRQTRLITK